MEVVGALTRRLLPRCFAEMVLAQDAKERLVKSVLGDGTAAELRVTADPRRSGEGEVAVTGVYEAVAVYC